jgi:hypothetical protein
VRRDPVLRRPRGRRRRGSRRHVLIDHTVGCPPRRSASYLWLRHLPVCLLLLGLLAFSACATTARRPPTVSPTGKAVAASALAYRGTPYRNGGATPAGFDCSGLVQYVFSQYGVRLPRTAAEQFALGRAVTARTIRPGDLVFFAITERDVSHVGIAITKASFVHAPASQGTVRVERLGDPYWARRFVAAKRLDGLLRAAR